MSILAAIAGNYLRFYIRHHTEKLIENVLHCPLSKKQLSRTVNLTLLETKTGKQHDIIFIVKNKEVTFIDLPDGFKMIALTVQLHFRNGNTEASLVNELTKVYGKGFVFKCN